VVILLKTNYLINCILVVLCIGAIIINTFFEKYKLVGIICILAIGALGVFKEHIYKEK
jgi:hypothetical protein